MTTAQLVMAVIAMLAILVPIGGTVVYRVRQLEIKVMNGLSDDVAEMKDEFGAVSKEMHDLKVMVVSLIEHGGGRGG